MAEIYQERKKKRYKSYKRGGPHRTIDFDKVKKKKKKNEDN